MKHLVLILILSLAAYFGWYYASKPEKRKLKKIGARHALAVTTIIVFALAMLVLMFYNRAINIL